MQPMNHHIEIIDYETLTESKSSVATRLNLGTNWTGWEPILASVPDMPQLTLPTFHAFAAATDRVYATTVAARFTPQSPRAPPHFV